MKMLFRISGCLLPNTFLDHWMNYKETRNLGSVPSSAVLHLCGGCVLSWLSARDQDLGIVHLCQLGGAWKRRTRWLTQMWWLRQGYIENLLTSFRAPRYWTRRQQPVTYIAAPTFSRSAPCTLTLTVCSAGSQFTSFFLACFVTMLGRCLYIPSVI